MNKGDIVKKTDGTKSGGRVRYVCCINSTRAGNGTCDKKTCMCPVRDFCFVEWPQAFGGGTSSLPETDLELDIVTPATNTGIADQMIADEGDAKPDTSLADKEKELAVQYEKIKASTPFDAKWFDAYNGIAKPKDYQKRYPKDPLA
jgi:hypothetical protein